MLRFPLLAPSARSWPRGVAALLGLAGALLVSSCLTPSIDFGEDPANRTGGTTGDGGSPGPGTGGAPGSGGMNIAGNGGDVPVLPDHCTNGVKDEDETDRNCGGDDCDPCAKGKSCDVDSDCVNDSCVMDRCQDPSCTDKVKNGEETDTDCGGGTPTTGCGPCDAGDSCAKPSDCDSGVCKSGTCRAPSCNDKVKNGTESDIDCGGTGDCLRCDSGEACTNDDDCEQPPTSPTDFATCDEDDDVCVITCGNPLFGDCNTQASDACETNLTTAIAHCGGCGDTCAPDNAVGLCTAGNCLIDTAAVGTNEGCLGNYANCNGETLDGCEADLDNDPETCSSCDTACSEANGTADCDNGVCLIDCDAGFDDCNTDVSDGCEADLTVSTLHCAQCNNACTAVPPEVPVCDGTQCLGITCNLPSDCGGVQPCGACDQDSPAPLCNDVLTTTTHCGGCGIDCTAANATTACEDNGGYSCSIAGCTGSYADCDEQYLNGCEIETDTARNRCGGCLASDPAGGSGVDCDATKGPQVAQTSCGGGSCKVLSCNSGYADCNGTWSDGCEVNLNSTDVHCGGCTSGPTTTWDGGANCDTLYPNANGVCTGGVCGFSSCTGNYENCDGGIVNGCETLAQGDPNNCGGCGNLSAQYKCVTNSNTTINSCSGSATTCSPTCFNNSGTTGLDYGDCDGEPWDGCETGLQSSVANCGACGNNCTNTMHTSGASAACSSAACAIATCDPGLADCNGTWSDGCELSFTANNTSCGGCTSGPTTAWDTGVNCSSSVGTNSIASTQCATSACSVLTCSGTRADCNGTFSDGCEIDRATSTTNCGGCQSGPTTAWDGGVNCSTTMHTSGNTALCTASTCSIDTCDPGLADCNGTWSDGCEVNIQTDPNNCGGCQSGPTTAWDGGVTCTSKQNATVSGCSTGACTYSCTSGWFNTNGDWSDGCESRTLVRVGNSGIISGDIASTGASGTYSVITAAGNYRLLLVGVICKANGSTDCTMTTKTYGGQALTQLGTTTGATDSWASMYYLLESGIAAATNTTLALDSAAGWGALSAQVVEYSGAEQTAPIAIFGGAHNANDCTNTNPDAMVTLSGVLSGSEVFAVSGGHSSAGNATAVSPLTLLGNNFNDPLDVMFGSGVATNQSGTLTNLTIALTGCFKSSIFAAAVKREVAP